jgi:hypothetical protein
MPRLLRKATSFRPSLELLEARNLLSTFTVDHLADDLVGTGLNGSLRYCISQANSSPGDDTITFAVTGTINLTGALPDLSSNIDLEGPGASSLTVRRDTGGDYRIFKVASGTTVVLAGLTITNGLDDVAGGGILNDGTLTLNQATVSNNSGGPFDPNGHGGGISNSGTLTVKDCTISGNSAGEFGGINSIGSGGGIYNNGGTVTLTNSTISGNSGGFGLDAGAGIYNNGGTITLSNATVTDNNPGGLFAVGTFGGGIYNTNNGTLILNNSVVSANVADGGGGILNDSGTVTLTNCTISANLGDGQGDGISNGYGTVTLTNCTIIANGIGNYTGTLTLNNSTVSSGGGIGGGIFNSTGSTLTLNNSTVSGNWGIFGGGICNNGTLTLNNTTVSGNWGIFGGGICNNGTLTLNNTTVSGNTTDGSLGGGGIYNGYHGTVTISNSTIASNHSILASGGGIRNDSGTVTISNSTIAGNTVGGSIDWGRDGGGIFNASGGTLHVRNTIIAGNTAPNAPDVSGSLGSLGHNLIGNDSGGSGFDPTDLRNVNPLLGPLQDNGGPTQTMALLAGSPALDAGDPAQLGVADQRGVVRSGGVNIGAYQASATAFLVTAPALTTAGTAFDLTVQAVDPFLKAAVGYTGTVHFGSTDGQATLPGNYPFTLGDAGVHTFTNGVTLKTAGRQTVTATDTVIGSLTGSGMVTVTPAAADHLLFLQQPTDTAAGQTMSAVIVEVVDAFGNVETSDNSDTITLSLGSNPSGGTLSGTLSVTVVHGVATFSNLSIDVAGLGYTLHAAIGGGLPDLDSNPFNITL